MIIAVDYDGTLVNDKEINIALFRRLIRERTKGAIIILWTCRDGYRLAEAVRTMTQHGLKPDYVNCNAPETIKRLGYDPRKILADLYIDDKSIRVC